MPTAIAGNGFFNSSMVTAVATSASRAALRLGVTQSAVSAALRRLREVYGDQLFVRTGRGLAPTLQANQLKPVVSDALPEDGWTGRTGFVHSAVLQDLPDLSGHEVYACGAPIVVESARTAYTAQRGLPAEEFFADSFTSEADKHR